MKLRLCLFALTLGATVAGAAPNLSPEKLAGYLKQFPEADTDHDGVLSKEEAVAFYSKMRGTQEPNAENKPGGSKVALTLENVKYGPDERNVLDFWRAKSDRPTALVVFIHGGGFVGGDKSGARGNPLLKECLDAGVSFAAINYRYRTTAPIQDVLRDCGRAIQFLRSQSGEWNLDKTRIASFGGSAGAGASLWLAFHPDLADPNNADPVLRESSRLTCAGAMSTQASYDVERWVEIFGEATVKQFEGTEEDGRTFYGLAPGTDLRGAEARKIRADCDMLGLISSDDPPVFLQSPREGGEVKDRGEYLHSPKHAKAVYDRCLSLGVTAFASLPGLQIAPPKDGPGDLRAFIFKYLGVSRTDAKAD